MTDAVSVFSPEDENHLVIHPCGHWVLKRLITAGQEEEEKIKKEIATQEKQCESSASLFINNMFMIAILLMVCIYVRDHFVIV